MKLKFFLSFILAFMTLLFIACSEDEQPTGAVWFNTHGGSGAPEHIRANVGSTITLPSPTRAGHTFNGWWTTASTGGQRIGSAGERWTVTPALINQWIHARWTPTGSGGGGGGGGGPVPPVTAAIRPTNWNWNQIGAMYDHHRRYWREQGNYGWIYAQGTDGTHTATISEAHGYGMKIFALMHNTPAARGDEQRRFDQMNALRKRMPSRHDSRLMSWLVFQQDIANPPVGDARRANATDGCLDIAYALLVAHNRFGSNSTPGHFQNYLEQARVVIAGLRESNMHINLHRTKLGDWQQPGWGGTHEAQTTTSRSSDWRPAHFRAFARATSGAEAAFWNRAADEVHNILDRVANANTGLMPDFIIGDPARVVRNEAEALVHGEHNWYHFAANACRVPWFLAMDFLHYGTERAGVRMNRITQWLRGISNNRPDNINAGPGFRLNGERIGGWGGTSMFFAGPFAAAAIANSGNQAFLNAMFTYLLDEHGWVMDHESEYGSAIRLLVALLITGNWEAP